MLKWRPAKQGGIERRNGIGVLNSVRCAVEKVRSPVANCKLEPQNRRSRRECKDPSKSTGFPVKQCMNFGRFPNIKGFDIPEAFGVFGQLLYCFIESGLVSWVFTPSLVIREDFRERAKDGVIPNAKGSPFPPLSVPILFPTSGPKQLAMEVVRCRD